MSSGQGWIGVDLDGTLAGWGDEHPTDVLQIGPPILPMVLQVKAWLAQGWAVRIFTARVGPASYAECLGALEAHPQFDRNVHDAQAYWTRVQRGLIDAWCLEHLGRILPITATKDFHMIALYDDRAQQVVSNQGVLVVDLLKALPTT